MVEEVEQTVSAATQSSSSDAPTNFSDSERFYSPLVKNIAKKEGISLDELEKVQGTGKEGRVTKNDILEYVENRSGKAASKQQLQLNQQLQLPVQPQISGKC